MMVKANLNSHRILFVVAGLVGAMLLVVGLWMFIGFYQPLLPRTVTMATGPAGGAYHAYGERYREIFARHGIELQLLPTEGAQENLSKLSDPHSGVSVGFLQGGIANEQSSSDLESLGTIFYEPLWFFGRDNLRIHEMEDLKGRRIAVGPEGSGTRSLVLELLARNGINEVTAELLPLSFQASSEKLLNGEIDVAFIMSSWTSPVVERLLAAEHIDLVSFPHADAHVAFFPFLSKMVVPAGVGDIVHNRPPTDTVVLAAKASLVVRSDLHPAIQYLLLDAAEQIHSGPGIFKKAGQFPAPESIDLPLSDEARRFYRSGQPFLQRFLPVWLAVLVGRLLFMLLPVLGLLYPLVRVMPALYGWKMNRRIYKLYHELRAIEQAWETRDVEGGAEDLAIRLDQLEEKADQLWVPVSAMGSLYLFKEHVTLVRKRLKAG